MSNGAWVVVGAAVGAVIAIVGGVLDRSVRSRSELISTASAWLAATEAFAIASQMDATFSERSSNKVGRGLERFVDLIEETLGPGRVELARALVQRPLLRRMERVSDQVYETTTLLVLRAPIGLLTELEPHLETLTAWTRAPGDAALAQCWNVEARPAIIQALRLWTQPRWRRRLHI
ncbi:MAG: hypothetical protein ACJ757_02185 [Gaiellaceae bacterium]